MWLLANIKDPGNTFYLLEGQNYTVGRKDCVILILNDSSVSRKHASLTVTHSEANLSKPEVKPVLTLSDSSKFGSLKNGNKIAGGSSTTLEDGDSIVFGAMNSNQWRVTYKPLVVAFSSLPSAEKKSLKQLTRKLGGHVVPEWSKECTHLIMTQLTVTIKVIGALVTCSPVVTPAYLHKIEEAAHNNSPMPDPNSFQPVVAEAAIKEDDVSFQANDKRRTLFKGKTIVFLAQKQFKQLGQTVRLAGGRAILIEEGLTKREENLLLDPNTIVMYADPQDQSQVMTQASQEWVIQVMAILKRNVLRPIPQSEFGLAVLYASTNVHCNPKVAQAGLTLLHPVAAPSLPTQDILASQTQPPEPPRAHSATKSKLASSKSPPEPNVQKKGDPREGKSSDQTPSKKRIREDDASGCSSPSKILRREPGKSTAPQPPTPETTPAPARGSAIPGASPELPYVGKQRSRPQEKESMSFVDSLKMDIKERAQGTGRITSPTTSKEDLDAFTTRSRSSVISSKTTKQDRTAAVDDFTYPDTSLGEVDISPSERMDENRSRSSKEKEQEPHKSRQWMSSADARKTAEENTESFAAETEDVIPLSRGDGRGRSTGRRRVQDLFATEMDDVREDEDVGMEQTVWKKVTKRSRLMEENDEVNDGSDAEQESKYKHSLQDVPAGYITANKAIKSEPTSPQDPTLPCNVAIVEQMMIAVRRPVVNGTHAAGNKRALNNFKKFKKASYAGQHSMPRIIGGSDLDYHGIGHIKEAEEMMDCERETQRKRHKEKDLADQLFDWDPRPAKRRR